MTQLLKFMLPVNDQVDIFCFLMVLAIAPVILFISSIFPAEGHNSDSFYFPCITIANIAFPQLLSLQFLFYG